MTYVIACDIFSLLLFHVPRRETGEQKEEKTMLSEVKRADKPVTFLLK